MSRGYFLVVALCIALCSTSAAHAAGITGQSRTYLQTRELTDGSRLTPLYEYLDVRTDRSGNDAISFSAGGWYRYYLQSEGFDKKDTGDLQYAYLTLRRKTANTVLRLGRIIVNEGAASAHLDGATVRTDLRGGFSVAGFAGIPLETIIDTRSGDSVFGGRIAHGIPGTYTVGLSYLKEKNDSADFREEQGIDLWVRPATKLELMGRSIYNAVNDDWMQHQYYAILGPFAWLRFNVEASKTWYGAYFSSATTSAFSPTVLDPNEIVTATGGSAVVSTGGPMTYTADYKRYAYHVLDGAASYVGGSVAYAGTSRCVLPKHCSNRMSASRTRAPYVCSSAIRLQSTQT